VVTVQVRKGSGNIKGNMHSLSEEVFALFVRVHRHCLVELLPVVNLVLQSALKTIQQQKVSTLVKSGKAGSTSRGHSSQLDNVRVGQRGQELGFL
jgi:hypothetical protein